MIFLGYLVNYFCLFNENMQISENRLSSCPFIFVSTRVLNFRTTVLLTAVIWHNLDRKSLFLFVLYVIPRISVY